MSRDPAYEIAHHLSQGKTKRGKGGNWICLCPAHEDRSPSFSIRNATHRTTGDPCILYHCYAKCSGPDIANALLAMGFHPFSGLPLPEHELRQKDTQPVRKPRIRPDDDETFFRRFRYAPTIDTAWHLRPSARPLTPFGFKLTRTSIYRSRDGNPRMIHYRFDKQDAEQPGKSKRFSTYTPWQNKKSGEIAVVSRSFPAPFTANGLETLSRPDPIWIVEGEKCRDLLAGLLRETAPVLNLFGSDPAKTDLTFIGDRRCLILPDFDEPGTVIAQQILAKAGKNTLIIPSVWRGTADPGPPRKWDIADDILGTNHFPPLTPQELAQHLIAQAARQTSIPARLTLYQAAARITKLPANHNTHGTSSITACG